MREPPELLTARCRLVVRQPALLPQLTDYKLRNRAHLEPWEPRLNPRFATPADAYAASVEKNWAGFQAGTSLAFMALDRNSGQMVADCSFTNITPEPALSCTLGYSVDATLQGQGLMFEVVSAAVAHVFDSVGLHTIMASHSPRNERSARLLQRLGFERVGLIRSHLLIAGCWEDMVLNALINPAHS